MTKLGVMKSDDELPTGGGTPSSTVANQDGTGAAGVSTDYSRGDHKHGDTARHVHANQTALDAVSGINTGDASGHGALAPIDSPTFTGAPAAPTAADGTNTTQLATTAYARKAAPNASYRTLAQAMASHIAAKVAGIYMLGCGDPAAVSGTGVLYPLVLIPIYAADYPTVNGLTAKLRTQAIISVNAAAPTGNFTVGLYAVTSGAGGIGVKIYTVGALVTNSACPTVTAPGASSMTRVISADFTPPADGVYMLAVVTTQTVAANSLVEINAMLQIRNT